MSCKKVTNGQKDRKRSEQCVMEKLKNIGDSEIIIIETEIIKGASYLF